MTEGTKHTAVPVVASVGVFDGVHLGHRDLLRQLRQTADACGGTTLALTFDRHPLALVAPSRCPLWAAPPQERAARLIDTGYVDRVETLPFDNALRTLTAVDFLRAIRSRYGVTALVMGYDNSFGSDCRGADTDHYVRAGQQAGVAVTRAAQFVLPEGTVVSSSAVRRALAAGDVALAARMLGRPFTLTGTVESGRQLGRQLGFPTANVSVDPSLQLPAPGVYAALCRTAGQTAALPCVVNIGSNPSVAPDNPVTVEAHIIGFSGNLYGTPLTLFFSRRLRDERRFDSLDALRAQIAADVSAAAHNLP